jgi:predicted metalloprotease with PDZ domain
VLAGAAILFAAGVLNFVQRARRETPPWDGVRWTDTKQGIIAETVEPHSSGARSRLLPGDRLIAINLSGLSSEKYQPIVRAADVQMYLEEARVGGQIH